jgi:hypothetical protein
MSKNTSETETTAVLFKIISKRVAKLPPVQQEEVIESLCKMVTDLERMNKSSALKPAAKQLKDAPATMLGKSATCMLIIEENDPEFAASLISSPSNIL